MSYQNPIELYVIIEQIVDSIRSIGSVSAYSEVSGTYTITSDNTLVNNDWITIDSIQYKVTDVSETGFTIKGETGLNFTNTEWKANAPYFMCEKEPKAGSILTTKTTQDTYEWQKYPLFLLTRPYTDDRSNRMIGYSTDFQLHIITDTESTYWSDDRIDNNFTPTLYPLYNAFMNALPLNRWVKEKYLEKINHSKTDSMFIDANPFPDKMDGLTIDFTDLEILKNRQICGIDTPQIYTVDLSSTTGGEAVSSLGGEGVYSNVAKDSNEAFNATAESGSRFVRWLLNGVENLTNPLALIIKKNYTIVAEFIEQVLLTTSVDGNGTITPISGTYDSGSEVTITATPNDVDTVLDRIEKNNITVSTTSPYQFVINELSNVVAYFQSTYEPETIQYINGLTEPISSEQSGKINTLVIELKTVFNVDSLEEVFDTLYIRANETSEVALKNLVKDANHSTLQGSPNPTFTQYEGYQSDGSNGYIDTGYNPFLDKNNFLETNASIGVYSRNNVNNASGTNLGSRNAAGTGDRTMLYLRSGGGTGLFIANNLNGNTYSQLDSTGLFIGTKDGLELKVYKNTRLERTTNGQNENFYNGNMYELGLNSGGNPNSFTTQQIAVSFMARKFTEQEVIDFTKTIEEYMDSLGTGVIEDYIIKYISPNINEVQGYTTDGVNHYCINSFSLANNLIRKRDSGWNIIEENLDAFNGTLMNHQGDGQYYDGKVYTVGSKQIDLNTSTDQNILVFDADDLTRISVNDVSSQGGNISGCCIIPEDNTIYVVYFDEPNVINKYNLLTFAYEGVITLITGVENLQGITYKEDYFYLSSHGTIEGIYKVAKDGSTTELIYQHSIGESEGIDYSQDELRFQVFNGNPVNVYYLSEL